MSFNEKLPEWNEPGVEPPQSKKDQGFIPGEKPPAQWFNWLFNRIYLVVKELSEKTVQKVDGKGLSTNDYTTVEKNKLAGISAGAEINMVNSVNNKTGDVELKASNINIDDTSNNFTATNVEGALAELFQSVANGKDDLYSALVTKGLNPMSRDFQDLYNAIITDDFVRTIEGDALASHILSGKKAVVDGVLVTGTIPSKAAATITPGTINQSIVAGQYLSGAQTIAGDVDLISGNIRSGANIFGVAGNANVVDTSAGDATAAQILSGKKAYVDGSLVTGNIVSKVAETITPGTTNKTIAAGQYLSGIQTILGDPDLTADNILSGKNIFGVTGTAISGVRIKSLQRGIASIIDSTTELTINVNAVNTSKSILLISHTGDSYNSRSYIQGKIINGTSIKIQRNMGFRTIKVSWELIEFENISIQSGEYMLADVLTGSTNINPVNTGTSFVLYSLMDSRNSEIPSTALAMVYLSNSTTIAFERNNNTSSYLYFSWYVLSFN